MNICFIKYNYKQTTIVLLIFILTCVSCNINAANHITEDTVDSYSNNIKNVRIEKQDTVIVKNRIFTDFISRYNFDRSYTLIISLFMVIVYSIATMLILLIIILLNRNHLEKRAKTNQFLKEKYQEALIDFLYKENEDNDEVVSRLKSLAGNIYNKRFLINEIIDLSINLKGDIAYRLRQLYFDLELNKVTFRNVYNRKWHYKVKGFRELAFMNITDANKEIEKALFSKNDILRMEAQIALVRLHEKEPFNFLNLLEKPFSLWEQMNIHELIIYHDLKIPDFTKWIKSKNKTIAVFAINMIRVFGQTSAFSELVKLLDDKDSDIRRVTIRSLGSFKTNEVLQPLKSHFTEEIYENKIEVLKALQVSTDESNISFLKWVLENENDVFIQIEAAKAIRNIGDYGKKELNELAGSDEYRNYQIILLHVLDQRI